MGGVFSPFQTLNFPVATQQMVHSETFPQRGLMTAAQLGCGARRHPPRFQALDLLSRQSHKMGMWNLDELGIQLDQLSIGKLEEGGPYTEVLAHWFWLLIALCLFAQNCDRERC